MSTLIARGVSKRFGATCAVDGVDLELAEGEVRGLLGPNGAGKTTLLRLLLGLLSPDEGMIELLGHPLGDADRLERVAGFVEDPAFYPYLSGRANLEVLAQLDGPGAGERIDQALAQVELDARAEERVAGYSSGMRKRLGIAAALTRAPRLLLLDEPTSGLDPGGVRSVGDLLRSLAGEGVSVLLSSHQISEVEEVCDSFSVLKRGAVVWEGTMARMRSEAPPSGYRMSTSDDARALVLCAETSLNLRAEAASEGGLLLSADEAALDRFVLALGHAGVAVRRLEQTMKALESMFFSLTDEPQTGGAPAAGEPAAAANGQA